jgi:hypothetical protein
MVMVGTASPFSLVTVRETKQKGGCRRPAVWKRREDCAAASTLSRNVSEVHLGLMKCACRVCDACCFRAECESGVDGCYATRAFYFGCCFMGHGVPQLSAEGWQNPRKSRPVYCPVGRSSVQRNGSHVWGAALEGGARVDSSHVLNGE